MIKKVICMLLCLIMVGLSLPVASGDSVLSVSYTMPNGRSDQTLRDADVMTRVTLKRGANITLKFAAGAGRTAYLEWFAIPEDAELQQLDAGGRQIKVTAFKTPDAYAAAIPLEANCAKLVLTAKTTDCTVSTLFISEEAPDKAYAWLEPTISCDMLFIAPTPASAMEAFGPVLARYGVANGVKVGIVCMTVDYRYRAQELEYALAEMGIPNAPIYLGCEDLNYLEPKEIHKRWAANKPADKLVALIASLQPKIVVSVGETAGDLRAAETVTVMNEVTQRASAQKFYTTAQSGGTVIDCTERLAAFSGMSAHHFATLAYRTMSSRGMYRVKLNEKPSFCLASETVGKDSACNDLLEHIDIGTLANYVDTATPAPTNTPSPEPTDTPEPTEAPEVPEQPAATAISGIFEDVIEEPATPTPQVTLVPKKGFFSCGGVEETPVPTLAPVVTEAPTAAPTPEPTAAPVVTEAPTPEPTEEPTPEPTEEPTPEPAAEITYEKTNFDEHFLNYGEEEFVSFDEENGIWIYRSDILAVEINRVVTTMQDGNSKRTKPVVYFVAHIYEREYDSFRPTFANWRHNGRERADALDMAMDAKCVLWITGDNLIHMDAEKKGTLIRDGYLFQKTARIDSCWLNPKTRTLEIVKKNAMTGDVLLESGVENCFSFGPVLVQNGEITKDAQTQRRENAQRTMIGMIEPGHLVAVVVDGRQDKYSVGTNAAECAQIMKDLGCVVSYNLDGGQSETMIFMGNKINKHGEGRYNGLSAKARTMPDGLSWGYSELCGKFRDLQQNNG